MSRRGLVVTGASALAGVALGAEIGPSIQFRQGESTVSRQPVVFLPHGGGPWPFVEMGLDRRECSELAAYLRDVAKVPTERPRALLVISAHWEAPVPTVSSSAAPPML